jgi:hypothetical protein
VTPSRLRISSPGHLEENDTQCRTLSRKSRKKLKFITDRADYTVPNEKFLPQMSHTARRSPTQVGHAQPCAKALKPRALDSEAHVSSLAGAPSHRSSWRCRSIQQRDEGIQPREISIHLRCSGCKPPLQSVTTSRYRVWRVHVSSLATTTRALSTLRFLGQRLRVLRTQHSQVRLPHRTTPKSSFPK